MAVLKTTSPVVLPVAPIDVPLKIVPSARAKMTGVLKPKLLNFGCKKASRPKKDRQCSKKTCPSLSVCPLVT